MQSKTANIKWYSTKGKCDEDEHNLRTSSVVEPGPKRRNQLRRATGPAGYLRGAKLRSATNIGGAAAASVQADGVKQPAANDGRLPHGDMALCARR